MIVLYFVLVSSGTFSIGIEWEYDEDRGDALFVKPKYANLKEEILKYEYLNVKLYQKEILPKATMLKDSNKVRSYEKTKDLDENAIVERLICMILYTDYTDLSAQFTATFRKRTAFEPTQATNRRHQHYYWMAKSLKEAILTFGKRYCDTMRGKRKIGAIGPFFCGMKVVMNMPQFNINLLSPVSTSVHLEVAVRFSGQSGIIIQFSNEKGKARRVRGVDMSWLSRFAEEDERYKIHFSFVKIFVAPTVLIFYRLFYDGGGYRSKVLDITSIRIIEENLNLEDSISAITALDNIISNNVFPNNRIPDGSNYGIIINQLLSQMMNKEASNQESTLNIHPYLYTTFKCFIAYKKEISIHIDRINDYVKDKKLLNILFDDIVKEKTELRDKEFAEVHSDQNLIRPAVFSVFKNLEIVNIITASNLGYSIYPFSLLSFLDIIEQTKVNKISIRSNYNYDEKFYPWLDDIETSSAFASVVAAYKMKKFDATIKRGSVTFTRYKSKQ